MKGFKGCQLTPNFFLTPFKKYADPILLKTLWITEKVNLLPSYCSCKRTLRNPRIEPNFSLKFQGPKQGQVWAERGQSRPRADRAEILSLLIGRISILDWASSQAFVRQPGVIYVTELT